MQIAAVHLLIDLGYFKIPTGQVWQDPEQDELTIVHGGSPGRTRRELEQRMQYQCAQIKCEFLQENHSLTK